MDKRGLSGIITAIVIIGIALVAVGVVWYTLNNVIEQQRANVENSSADLFKKCIQAGYYKMNESFTTCDGIIKYIGGEKCCTIEPVA